MKLQITEKNRSSIGSSLPKLMTTVLWIIEDLDFDESVG